MHNTCFKGLVNIIALWSSSWRGFSKVRKSEEQHARGVITSVTSRCFASAVRDREALRPNPQALSNRRREETHFHILW